MWFHSFVILSEAKNLPRTEEMLHYVQHDKY